MKTRFNEACIACGKGPAASYNRPKSLHKTKRVVYPNLVKFGDAKICTRCLKSLRLHAAQEQEIAA